MQYHDSNLVNLFTHLIYIRILNKCFAVISLILKLKAAGMSNAIYIYMQYRTEIKDIIKHNYIIQRIVK